VVEPGGLRDTSGRVLPARHFAERLLQSILALLGLAISFGRCRLRDRRLCDLSRDAGGGRLSISSSARRAHDYRRATFLAENLEATPSTSRSADSAAASVTFDLDQVFVAQGHPL
jgi:hypothetical protein